MKAVPKRWIVRTVAVAAVAAAAAVPFVLSSTANASISGTQVVSASVSVPALSQNFVIVSCPAGKTSTSGGFQFLPTLIGSLMVDISRPEGSGWLVHARNTTSAAQTVSAYAVCSAATGRVIAQASTSAAPNDSAVAQPACPSGTNATGGGYRIDPDLRIIVYHNWLGTRGWDIAASNRTTGTRTIAGYVVCAIVPGWTSVSATKPLAPLGSASVIATCPSGRIRIGGGWSGTIFDRQFVNLSMPVPGNTRWRADFRNTSSSLPAGQTASTLVICGSGS